MACKVDHSGFLDLIFKDRALKHLHPWVCHVEHLMRLLGQDDEHEDLDDQWESGPEPGLVGLAAPIIEREGVAEAILA